MTNLDEIKYQEALAKVAKIKKFYKHLLVYIIVNAFIVFKKLNKIDEGETSWHAFYVPIFWGIGLLIHALKTFDSIPFFGKDWEEKKIKEFMNNKK